jgi:hypothetical protein
MIVKGMARSSVSYMKLVSRNLPGRTEETHENVSQGSRSPGRYRSVGPPEYEERIGRNVSVETGK